MTASELRIGNIIKVPNHTAIVTDILQNINGGHIRFKTLGSEEKKTFGYYLEVCEPIPVTDEWLLKFGFFYDIDSKTFKISDCTLQLDDYDDEGFMVVLFGDDLRLIKYIHQLQNLYHALTGEELTLKN